MSTQKNYKLQRLNIERLPLSQCVSLTAGGNIQKTQQSLSYLPICVINLISMCITFEITTFVQQNFRLGLN